MLKFVFHKKCQLYSVSLCEKLILSFSRPAFCWNLTWWNLKGLAELANLTVSISDLNYLIWKIMICGAIRFDPKIKSINSEESEFPHSGHGLRLLQLATQAIAARFPNLGNFRSPD